MRYPFGGVIRAASGPALANQSVYIYSDAAGSTLATIYAAASGGGALPNPTTTTSRGILAVYCESPALWFKVVGDTLVQRLNHYAVGGIVLDALDFGAVGDGVTDDTAELTAMLAAVGTTGARCWVPDGNYLISAPLVIHSNTHLDLSPGATITLKAGSLCNILKNVAMTPQRSVADAAMTITDATLTSATAAFTAADIGRTVVVADAVPTSQPLVADIVSVNSSTSVELSLPAQATISGKSCSIHDRDKNIIVTGGTWDRGANEGSSVLVKCSLVFRHVDHLRVGELVGLSTGGKYFISPADVTDFDIGPVWFDTVSDGVDVRGPAHHGHIHGVYGNTGDDSVALLPPAGDGISDTAGSMSHILVENVNCDALNGGGGDLAKVLGGKGWGVNGVTFRDIHGNAHYNGVYVGDDASMTANMVGGWLDDITVENVGADSDLASSAAVYLNATNAGDISVRRVVANSTTETKGIHVDTGAVIARLRIDDLDIVNLKEFGAAVNVNGTIGSLTVRDLALRGLPANGNGIIVGANGAITSLLIDGVSGTLVGYLVFMGQSTGSITRAMFRGVATTGGGALWRTHVAGASMPNVSIANSVMNAPVYAICDTILTQNVYCVGVCVIGAGTAIANVRSGAVVVITAHGCEFGHTTIADTGTVASRSFGLRTDVGRSGFAKNANDMAYNTNAGRACGVGPVVCNGTSWKHLYTGAEYTP